MMNRAEYEAVASGIHEADGDRETKVTVALEVATNLCATNDRFDPVRFLQQTGLGLTADEIADYSHTLLLRTRTGVGATRADIRAERRG
jgi:hypothetical protein